MAESHARPIVLLMEIHDYILISRIAVYSAIIPLSFYFLYRNLWKGYFQWIGVFLIGSILFEAALELFPKIGLNPNIVINLWIIYEFVIYSIVFLLLFKANRFLHSLVLWVLVIMFFLGLFNFFFLQGISSLNSYTRSTASIIMVIYSIVYFFLLIENLPTDKLTNLPLFWIVTAILLYFSGTFILNISIDYLLGKLNSDLMFFWIFLLVLNFIRNILFVVALSFHRKSILQKSV